MIRKKAAAFVLYVLLIFAFWNLFDFLIAVIFTHSTYAFTLFDDVVLPAVVAAVTGYAVIYGNDNKKNKKNKK